MLPRFLFSLGPVLTGALVVAAVFASAALVGGARSAGEPSGLIAFARWDGIYVIRADGSGERALRRGGAAAGVARLAWSPDGNKLAFLRGRSPGMALLSPEKRGLAELYVMNADGSGVKRLTHNRVGEGSPAWQPVASS